MKKKATIKKTGKSNRKLTFEEARKKYYKEQSSVRTIILDQDDDKQKDEKLNNLNCSMQFRLQNRCAVIKMGNEGKFRVDPNSGEVGCFDIYSVELNINIGTGRMSEILGIINAFLIGRKINK